MEKYRVLSEWNSFLRETYHYLIRTEGNERFIEGVLSKLPEECGFEFDEEISEDEAKSLANAGNKVSLNTRYEEYILVDKVPDQKVVELGFIEDPNSLLKFLTIGRFLGDRETSKVNAVRKEKVKGNGQGEGEVGQERSEDHTGEQTPELIS